MPLLDRCPDCGADWPGTLRLPFRELKQKCMTCFREKDNRIVVMQERNMREREARAEERNRKWEAMTSEERRASAQQDVLDLFGP